MRSNLCGFVVAVTIASALSMSGADVRIPLPRQNDEWIGSSFISNDGSGAVVLASHAPRYSRLVSFDKSGATSETKIPGIAINAIEPVGGNRYFISGAIDSHYVARLIETTPTGISTLWDSTTLGQAVTRNENAVVAMDRTGNEWTALVPSVGGRFSVLFGSTSNAEAAARHDFESKTSFQGKPGSGSSGGSYDVKMLGGRAAMRTQRSCCPRAASTW